MKMKMNHAVIDKDENIRGVFASLVLAEVFLEHHGYEEYLGYRIELTKEPLTVFPEGSYFAKWNK